jgi:hypothetical protein
MRFLRATEKYILKHLKHNEYDIEEFKITDSLLYIVAYLFPARTVEPQKQPLLSNTRKQEQNNGLDKHPRYAHATIGRML